MGRISKSRRYMIDVTRTGPALFGELGESSVLVSLVLLDVLGR